MQKQFRMQLFQRLGQAICRGCQGAYRRHLEKKAARAKSEPEEIIDRTTPKPPQAQEAEPEKPDSLVEEREESEQRDSERPSESSKEEEGPLIEEPEKARGPAAEKPAQEEMPDEPTEEEQESGRDSMFERAQLLREGTDIPADVIPHILLEIPNCLDEDVFYDLIDQIETRMGEIKRDIHMAPVALEIIKFKPELLTLSGQDYRAEYLTIKTKLRIIDGCVSQSKMSSKGVNYYEDITVLDLEMITIINRTEATELMERHRRKEEDIGDLSLDSSLSGRFHTNDVIKVFQGFGFRYDGRGKEHIVTHKDGRRISIPDDHGGPGGFVSSRTLDNVIMNAKITRRMFIDMAGVAGVLNKKEIAGILSMCKQRDIDIKDLVIARGRGEAKNILYVYDGDIFVGQVSKGSRKKETDAKIRKIIDESGETIEGCRVWFKTNGERHIAKIPALKSKGEDWEIIGDSREEVREKARMAIKNVVSTTLFQKAIGIIGDTRFLDSF